MKKGDVLAVAQVAAVMAAKKTWDLIPMCHPIPLTGVNISFSWEKDKHEYTINYILLQPLKQKGAQA